MVYEDLCWHTCPLYAVADIKDSIEITSPVACIISSLDWEVKTIPELIHRRFGKQFILERGHELEFKNRRRHQNHDE